MRDVLLLNADFAPVGIVPWERAVGLLLSERVRVVETYPGRRVRSPSLAIPWPSVVHLKRYARVRSRPAFTRRNVFTRDHHTCQYCGRGPILGMLTLDHVVPRAHALDGRVTGLRGAVVAVHSWENVVAACRQCNALKGARTPSQAGMTLARLPREPGPTDVVRFALRNVDAPLSWRAFLPERAAA